MSATTDVILSGTIHTDTTKDFAGNAVATVSLNSAGGAIIARFSAPSVATVSVPP